MIQPVASRRHAIADDLRNQISTGRIAAGERLPSESELASHYKVSTPTLRNALAILQAEGLVEKIHGKGNFVRRRLRRLTYVGGGRLTDAWSGAEEPLRVTISATNIKARRDLAALLGVSARTTLTEFVCLSYEGNQPHSLARIYVPRDLAPTDLTDGAPWRERVEERLAELCPPLVEIRETVGARCPTPEEASTLRISSALAVLAITRVAADIAGRVVEAAVLVLPGDRADAVFTTHHTTEGKGKEG
ncbi:GntR family transcriptional regulator [Streptomyces sp. LHD-70]|uniref:GntR family transcriptional regulator n=1 Tax=Streptomyces sp. LHD-70 TaxID=3072140 RepID=UPI00281023A4|nr:GntR family transcriptional regulator [Streptomyces sp. LHD-70]MDQ8706651.1 GntR family transcriptional regulator [Streptomyces sp. LHD-70]